VGLFGWRALGGWPLRRDSGEKNVVSGFLQGPHPKGLTGPGFHSRQITQARKNSANFIIAAMTSAWVGRGKPSSVALISREDRPPFSSGNLSWPYRVRTIPLYYVTSGHIKEFNCRYFKS